MWLFYLTAASEVAIFPLTPVTTDTTAELQISSCARQSNQGSASPSHRQDPKKVDPSPLRHFHYLLVASYWTRGSFWSAWRTDGGTSSRISPETVGLLRPIGHWDAAYTWKRETVGMWSPPTWWQSLPRVQQDTHKCWNMLIYSWRPSRTESNEAGLLTTLTALEKLHIMTCFVSNYRPSLTEDYHRPPGKRTLTWQRPVVSAGGQKAQNHD